MKTCNTSHAITNDDFVTLHEHGFSDDDILGYWRNEAAFFCLVEPDGKSDINATLNAEFYALGRDFSVSPSPKTR